MNKNEFLRVWKKLEKLQIQRESLWDMIKGQYATSGLNQPSQSFIDNSNKHCKLLLEMKEVFNKIKNLIITNNMKTIWKLCIYEKYEIDFMDKQDEGLLMELYEIRNIIIKYDEKEYKDIILEYEIKNPIKYKNIT